MEIDLMRPVGCQMSKHLSAAFTQQVTRFSGQASAHRGVLMVDAHIAPGADGARKSALVYLHEPTIRIDHRGHARQRWKRRASHPWREVATRARLVGPLAVGVGQERLGDLTDLGKRAWAMHLEALLAKRTVKAFDGGIEVGPVRRDHMRRHPYTPQEARPLRKGNRAREGYPPSEDRYQR
jgi:hypothetical protein